MKYVVHTAVCSSLESILYYTDQKSSQIHTYACTHITSKRGTFQNLQTFRDYRMLLIMREEIFKRVKSMSYKIPSQSKLKIWFTILKSRYIKNFIGKCNPFLYTEKISCRSISLRAEFMSNPWFGGCNVFAFLWQICTRAYTRCWLYFVITATEMSCCVTR
jgi:hypothetical protein